MCLSTGIDWHTYWTLTGVELAALTEAARRIDQRRKLNARKRRG